MRYIILIILSFFLFGCGCQDFGKGVQKDVKETFISKKEYFNQIGFSGILYDKRHFPKSSVAPYRLYIRLKTVSEEVPFQYLQFPPYYSFNSLSLASLEISVSNDIYKKAIMESVVQKSEKTDSLQLNESVFLLLSNDSQKWSNNGDA